MKVPRPITKLIESFERLPGIGPKTAQRLTFRLLHFPEDEIKRFADSLLELKTSITLCTNCKNVAEGALCSVCDDASRVKEQIAVVSGPLDVFALERTGYKGMYHVLHGLIDPLNNMGPEELFVENLRVRVKNMIDEEHMVELILATNTSMEGETTAMYISRMFKDMGYESPLLKITRIARGLPVGGDIEYADDITLSRALDGRSVY